MQNKLAQVALRTSLLYGFIAALWILLSDRALVVLFPDPAMTNRLQTYKGWFFVIVTALLLYAGLRRQLRRWEQEAADRRKTEKALQQSEAKYRAAIETSADGFWVVDMQGRFLEVNDAYVHRSGYSREELLTMRIADVDAQETPEETVLHIERNRREETALFESRHRAKDGTLWQVELNATYWPIAGGRLFVFVRDLYRRKRFEALLRARVVLSDVSLHGSLDQLLQTTLDTAELLTGSRIAFFHFVDEDQENLSLQAWSSNTVQQKCTAEAQGLHSPVSQAGVWVDCFHRRVPVIHNDYAALAHKKGLPKEHAPVVRELTVPVFRNERVAAIVGVGNKSIDYTEDDVEMVQELASMAMDLVDRRRVEEQLHVRNVAIQSSVSPIGLADLKGNLIFANEAYLRLWGYDDEKEILGRHISEFALSEEQSREVANLLLSGKGFIGEGPALRKDGTTFDVQIAANLLKSPDGKSICTMASFVDITERKLAERRLATQSAVGQVLTEADSLSAATPKIIQALCEAEGWEFGMIWEVDRHTNLLRCIDIWHMPDALMEELATKVRERSFPPGVGLPGRVWKSEKPVFIPDVTHDDNLPKPLILVQAGLRSALGFPILLRGETTGVIDVWSRKIPEPDEKLLEMLGTVGSLIGQFIERKRAQEELQRFVSLSPAVLYALRVEDDEIRTVWTSENIRHLTGYTEKESMERDWWVDHIHPEDRARVLAAQQGLYDTAHQILDFRFRRKDGSYFWVRDEKRLLYDEKGKPAEIIGSWSDITERVKMEEQYRQSQKMEAIGQLSGGVAHDFNNILTVILGHVGLLGMRKDLPLEIQESAGEIGRAAERAANLTRQLLMFSRRQTLQLRDLDLNEVVTQTTKMLQRVLGENIQMQFRYAPKPLFLHADAGMMDQILLNLAVNSRDAMSKGGRLLIETSEAEIDEGSASQLPEAQPGSYACLSVSDTGGGIPPDVLPHIFEPFFTTKEVGKGTGLGLATVYGIVQQHHGWINVYSRTGQGTTIRVYLPRLAMASDARSERASFSSLPRGRETILLVEDESALRTLVGSVLSQLGYRILDASSGPGALEQWRQHKDDIHLLLTDIVMPDGMSGIELAERLLAEKPGLKILYSSGYSAELAGKDLSLQEGVNFLAKPYDPHKLAQTVRTCLDAR